MSWVLCACQVQEEESSELVYNPLEGLGLDDGPDQNDPFAISDSTTVASTAAEQVHTHTHTHITLMTTLC